MDKISSIKAIEILDSRGRPTVKAFVELSNGVCGRASVPSGASTGKAEALELRDHDDNRYNGYGCLKAVSNINKVIAEQLVGTQVKSQEDWDNSLTQLDGTKNKSNLGANAILAVSLAYAKAMAILNRQALFSYFNSLIIADQIKIPQLTINLFSGGRHAGGQVPVQDVLLVPQATGINNSLVQVEKVYQSAVRLIHKKYNSRWLTADEGGLAPPFPTVLDMLNDTVQAISDVNLVPGEDMCIALDVAASQFYKNGYYEMPDQKLNGEAMIKRLSDWVEKFPIVSMEDGLAEDDWEHWPLLKSSIEEKCLVLGDDLLCTQTNRIQKAIDKNAANALLLKVNQIGTITEAAQAYELAKKAGWHITVSARSGETEDDWLADLAVGWGADHIKVGSITQSERLAKYNRLLEIEANEIDI